MNQFIEQALESIRANAGKYDKPERYYRGEHNLAFASDKFQSAFGTLFREFAMNLCPVICDAVRDKLRVNGFSVEANETGISAAALNDTARRIWHRNKMAIRSGEVHKEALKTGDAYVIVWPSPDGEAVIYGNRAASCTAFYDEEVPGRIKWAAKYWKAADQRARLNIFFADRTEMYVSKGKYEGSFPDGSVFRPFAENGRESVLKNPFGVVPVFHFANNADIGSAGTSELAAAIPIQDGLNKSVLDMLVAMEFSSFRQRWVAGLEVETDNSTGELVPPFKSGVDRLWITQNPDARFGDFQAADLEQFLKVKEGFRVDMASVTGTPLHYFMQSTKGVPSGQSLRKTETRFLAKVRDRQESWGRTWADVMEFAIRAEQGAGGQLTTLWEDPAPVSEREILENLVLKRRLGVSTDQLLSEAGYGEKDAERMRTDPKTR